MRIRVLVAAAALIAVAGGTAGCSGTTGGTALPVGETPSQTMPAQTTATPTTAAPTTMPTTASPTTAATGATTAAPSGRAPAAPPRAATPVSTRCHTSELTASFGPQDAGAGQRYATIVLGNRGHRTCTVFGYGGMQPLDSAKKLLPVTLTRDPAHRPTLVRLVPGGQVSKVIHWTVIPSGTQQCPTPAYAEVTPPDETDPIVIAWPFAEVCGGRIDGFPYGAKV